MATVRRARVKFNASPTKAKRRRSTRVLVFGAFDIFHPGHRHFFQQAKNLGTELIVAVGRDKNISVYKGRRPHHTEATRLARVAREPLVDRALLAASDPRRRWSFIRQLRPDIIALGHDQTTYTKNLAAELERRGLRCQVVRLRPYRRHLYRSSTLRQRLEK